MADNRINMKKASAFTPGHLTGLFQICDQPEDPIYKGSRGSGISICKGVHTHVTAEPSEATSYLIKINGEVREDAFVSENVLAQMLPRLNEPCAIQVEHKLETPMTAGFGSSGGGALSLALALNKSLSLDYSFIEAARVAHIAEIECKTGLGTVFAALEAGFGVLVSPGGPGIGKGVYYEDIEDLRVVYVYFGPIHTKDALSNPELRKKINELGGKYVDELHQEQTPERFMEFSRSFSEHVGLITPRLRRALDFTDKAGYVCTMAMFGEVLFSVQWKENVNELYELLKESIPDSGPVLCEIDGVGVRLT